jgi:hypothetical protein
MPTYDSQNWIRTICNQQTLETTEGQSRRVKSRETGNILYTKHKTKTKKTKTKRNMCLTSHYATKHK